MLDASIEKQTVDLERSSSWKVDKDITNGNLVDVFPKWEVSAGGFDSAAWIVYPSKNYRPKKTRVFIDYLKSAAQ